MSLYMPTKWSSSAATCGRLSVPVSPRYSVAPTTGTPGKGYRTGPLPAWRSPNTALRAIGRCATTNYTSATNTALRAGTKPRLGWDDLSLGLTEEPYINALALNRGRFFAGLQDDGVWMYDDPSETWIPVGLQSLDIHDLVSHQGYLYAAAGRVALRLEHPDRPAGIYRAAIPIVNSYNKAVATWGALKRP